MSNFYLSKGIRQQGPSLMIAGTGMLSASFLHSTITHRHKLKPSIVKSLVGGKPNQPYGFGIALRHAAPPGIHQAQLQLSDRIILIRCDAVQPCGFSEVWVNSQPLLIQAAKFGLGDGIPRRRSLSRSPEKLHGFSVDRCFGASERMQMQRRNACRRQSGDKRD
jgi:hypothetical protein